MCFFGLVPPLAHPYPCTHSHVFLRVLNGLSGQRQVILSLFEAILGSGCETLWAGGKGRALVSALRDTVGLGMGTAGAGQGGGKPWDVHRKQPKESWGSCRGGAGWGGGGGVWTHVAVWCSGEMGGVMERVPDPLGTLPQGQGLPGQLQQTSNVCCSRLDPAAIPPSRDCSAVERIPAGQRRVWGSFYRPFPSRSIKGGWS